MLRPADSVLRWCRHRGMKMYEPLFRVCVTVPGTFSLNRADRRPLSGRDVTLRLQSRMVSVEPEPPKRDIHELSGRKETMAVSDASGSVQVPSEGSTGETEATLADCGRFRKQLTCHQGWFPNLHEMPGMIQDSTLASCPEWDMSANEDTPRVSMHG